MRYLRKQGGFTLIELLVVILILAILMAIALPLYLRAVRDSERQTCRTNMQTIATAEQAYRVRSPGHVYTNTLSDLVGVTEDLQALPQCPTDTAGGTTDYSVTILTGGPGGEVTGFTVTCLTSAGAHGTFTPGVDSE